jgi:hypothetical protein
MFYQKNYKKTSGGERKQLISLTQSITTATAVIDCCDTFKEIL